MAKMYQLELTHKQLLIVKDALEVYGRMQQGRIDLAIDAAIPERESDAIVNNRIPYLSDSDEIKGLRKALFPELMAYEAYGVGNNEVPNLGISYTILEAIRYQLWIEQPESERSSLIVDGQRPLRFGNEPIPNFKKIDN